MMFRMTDLYNYKNLYRNTLIEHTLVLILILDKLEVQHFESFISGIYFITGVAELICAWSTTQNSPARNILPRNFWKWLSQG